MSFLSKLWEFFTPKVIFVGQSELSNPTKKYAITSKNEITKKILLDNPEARDDEEYFLWLVEDKCTNRMDMIGFDRSWRYIQQHFPTLRWETWNERQKKAELYRKNL